MCTEHEVSLLCIDEKLLHNYNFVAALQNSKMKKPRILPECVVLFSICIPESVLRYFADFLVWIPARGSKSGLPRRFAPHDMLVYGGESQAALENFLCGIQKMFRNAPDEKMRLFGSIYPGQKGLPERKRITLHKTALMEKLDGLINAVGRLSKPNHYLIYL